jgi:hypothetical protein
MAIPGDEEMERRKLVSSYRREQRNRTGGINRLYALFVHARDHDGGEEGSGRFGEAERSGVLVGLS